jgi:sterol desaturase/sphingolipid hydroxylase (fatty acid hydroxylase superfamily)
LLIKFTLVSLLGAAAVAVVIFEVLLNGVAMFNHANIQFPKKLDDIIRLIVVTPDMHRVHHSRIVSETNSNYGFNLPWWDRLFGSYQAQPSKGHEEMEIGVNRFDDVSLTQYFHNLLLLPFKK